MTSHWWREQVAGSRGRIARSVGRRARGKWGARYSAGGEERVIARLVASLDAPQVCVDIGAGDGRTGSNTLALYERGWGGLSVEVDPATFAALSARYARFPNVALARTRVTPHNVLEIMQGAALPRMFGVLSLDIDGYDFFVLDQILSVYQPAVVCTEINEKIPPPLRFAVLYDPEYRWGANHFYGQSIGQLGALCEKHGYSIVELEYNNAFLMPSNLAPASLTPTEAYRRGYRNRADRRTRFPWNDDMEHLQTLSPVEAVAYLNDKFAPYRGKYVLDLGDVEVSSD